MIVYVAFHLRIKLGWRAANASRIRILRKAIKKILSKDWHSFRDKRICFVTSRSWNLRITELHKERHQSSKTLQSFGAALRDWEIAFRHCD